MASIQYDVVYVARSPANTRQEDFAAQVDEICNGRAARGWRLMSAVGDYGAKVTLGVWLYFTKEGDDLDSFGSGADTYGEEPLGSGRSDEGLGEGEPGGGYGGDEGESGGGYGGGGDEGESGGGYGGGGDEGESAGEDLGSGSDEEPA